MSNRTVMRSKTRISFPLIPVEVWDFSVAYYSIKEVKCACLDLQEHYGGSIGLILLLKFLDETGLTIGAGDWKRVVGAVSVSETLIRDFRCLRRQLKYNAPERIYQQSMGFELQLEKYQQLDLIRHVTPVKTPGRNAKRTPLTSKYCIQLTANCLAPIFSRPTLDLHSS